MRRFWGWPLTALICVLSTTVSPTTSFAAPSAKEQVKKVQALVAQGEVEAALVEVDEALRDSPRSLPLLLLRGQILLLSRDYPGALAAYKAYLAAGATGGNKREVIKIVGDLDVVSSTWLDIKVSPGPAKIYLDSRTLGLFCEAAPDCSKQIVPGKYKVIAEREGYQRSSQNLKVESGTRQAVNLTLTEKPSNLTVTASVPGAAISIDGQPAGESPLTRELPAGDHVVEVTHPGHGAERRTVSLREGNPATLDIALCDQVTLDLSPASATVLVDGAAARIDDGKLCLSPGEHQLSASAPAFHGANATVAAERPTSVELELRAIGALLQVEGAPSGAELLVDGQPRGTLPLAEALEIEPGDHAIELRGKGWLPFRGRANLLANTPARVRVTKVRRPGRPKAWLFGGVAAAATVSGVVLGVLAFGKASDHDDLAAQSGISADDPTLDDLRQEGDRFALVADIAFATAVVTAGISTYFFIKEGKGFSRGKIEVGVGAGAVGLQTRGSF